MRIPKGKKSLIALLVSFLGLLAWQFGPFQAVSAVSSLSDPAKLATLGERGANSRLNKIVYWLNEADGKGMSYSSAIGWAQTLNGTGEPRATLVKESLIRNMQIADQLGLLTPENKDKLRNGHAAVVTKGPYAGSNVEIDHIVPFSLAPEIGNELANLEMLPQPLNRSKSNKVGERQKAMAEKFLSAGLLTKESFERVESFDNDTRKSIKSSKSRK